MSASTERNDGAVSLLRELRDRDSETGLLTETRLYQALLSEIARSERYGNPLACVLLQVRGLGPEQRTTRLEITNRVAVVMRNTDYAGIWREDEFLLVLPETADAGARRFADKVKQELTDLAGLYQQDDDGDFEVVTRVTSWTTGDDAKAMLERLETKTRA